MHTLILPLQTIADSSDREQGRFAVRYIRHWMSTRGEKGADRKGAAGDKRGKPSEDGLDYRGLV